MDRNEILNLTETGLTAAAHIFADAIFEKLSVQINEQVEERIAEWYEEHRVTGDDEGNAELDHIARELLQPAFANYVHDRLSRSFVKSSNGWNSIFWTNLNERYNETGAL